VPQLEVLKDWLICRQRLDEECIRGHDDELFERLRIVEQPAVRFVEAKVAATLLARIRDDAGAPRVPPT
jgi:hypothetical protein